MIRDHLPRIDKLYKKIFNTIVLRLCALLVCIGGDLMLPVFLKVCFTVRGQRISLGTFIKMLPNR